MRPAWLVLVLCLLFPGAVHADPPAPAAVRAGSHGGFGRIVFDVPGGTRYKLTRSGDSVTVDFGDGAVLQAAPASPRNVRGLKSSGGQAQFAIVAGATLRETRIDGHVVIDVLDARTVPTPPKAPAEAAKPPPDSAKPPPEPAKPQVEAAPAKAAEPLPPPMPVAEQPPPPPPVVPPPTQDHGPVALLAAPTLPPEGVAITVPFAAQTGAAQFRRGSNEYLVFDERRPIDFTSLRGNPVFGSAVVRELPSGTLIVLHPPPGSGVALTRMPQGWRVSVRPSVSQPRGIPFTPKDGHLDLPAEAPGNVVSMADPDTGATLLVGTLRRPGQAFQTARRTPEFTMIPASLGLVVEPLADSVALRTVPTGFQIAGGPGGLALTAPSPATDAAAAAAHLTRRFQLPAQSAEALQRARAAGISATAATPAQARGPQRRAIASALLSLGMGAEAEAQLRAAAERDPKEAASAETAGLRAIAALLADRPADAAGIDDPRLSGTDEIALWRAIRQAAADDQSRTAAATLATTAPLALLYPAGIRDRILPKIAETLILGGEAAAAKRLLGLAGDVPGLGYARALLRQADGDAPGALAALDALADGRDQRDRARAATRAVELRLASGQLDATKAADALDKLRYAWRGDRRELALRERIADLHQQAGAWRVALSDLRSAAADFPAQAQAIQTHLMGMFITLLYSQATDALSPLDLVALVDENADLFKSMPANEDLQTRLADRLMALDLPSRASPLLEKLIGAATTAGARANFGARLATLRLNEGDAAGAVAALSGTAAADLEPRLAEQRRIIAAHAKSRLGDAAGAIEALAGLTGSEVGNARAAVYERAGNWPAAAEALMQLVGLAIPPAGELNDAQRQLVLRLATAEERSGDRNGLTALRATLDGRLGSGPVADTIRLLTAAPVLGTGDLPRSEREMGLAKALPAAMAAVKPP